MLVTIATIKDPLQGTYDSSVISAVPCPRPGLSWVFLKSFSRPIFTPGPVSTSGTQQRPQNLFTDLLEDLSVPNNGTYKFTQLFLSFNIAPLTIVLKHAKVKIRPPKSRYGLLVLLWGPSWASWRASAIPSVTWVMLICARNLFKGLLCMYRTCRLLTILTMATKSLALWLASRSLPSSVFLLRQKTLIQSSVKPSFNINI